MLLYLVCVAIGLALPSIARGIYSKLTATPSNELYDQADAVTLNLVNRPNGTFWFNMGWWEQGGKGEFAEAATLLCRKIAQAARLSANQRIVEVGYGSGDSTLLLAKEFSPKSYTGFTSLVPQHALASRRVDQANFEKNDISVRHGDAATALRSLPTGSAEVVLAVDCAFHFKPRESFFSGASAVLSPDGRLALTDLLLPSTPLSLLDSIALRIICILAQLPFENLLTLADYRSSLVRSGFEEESIEMEDISDRVWPGFLAFVENREREMGVALGASWKGLRMYAKVVKWYSGVGGGRQRLRFYMISAKKADRKVY
ncbi:hypothetical protein JCM16303_003019 [Sporobolomyces ruberrimus]